MGCGYRSRSGPCAGDFGQHPTGHTHLRGGRRLQAQLLQLLCRGRLGRELLRLVVARHTLCRLQLRVSGGQPRLHAVETRDVLRLQQRLPQLQVGERPLRHCRTLVGCFRCPPAMQAEREWMESAAGQGNGQGLEMQPNATLDGNAPGVVALPLQARHVRAQPCQQLGHTVLGHALHGWLLAWARLGAFSRPSSGVAPPLRRRSRRRRSAVVAPTALAARGTLRLVVTSASSRWGRQLGPVGTAAGRGQLRASGRVLEERSAVWECSEGAGMDGATAGSEGSASAMGDAGGTASLLWLGAKCGWALLS